MSEIADKMRETTQNLNILPEKHFGVSEHHVAEHQVFCIVEYTAEILNRKVVTTVALLEVARVVDRVWHDRLVVKMDDFGHTTNMVPLVDCYLRGKSIRVKLAHIMSGYRTAEAGIPLGSVLGPHLFAVYTTDIPRQEETILGEYADDTAIEYSCKSVEIATRRTQKALDGISD